MNERIIQRVLVNCLKVIAIGTRRLVVLDCSSAVGGSVHLDCKRGVWADDGDVGKAVCDGRAVVHTVIIRIEVDLAVCVGGI